MREGSRLRRVPLLGVAVSGLVLGHALAYLIAIPDPHRRSSVLSGTGHQYLPTLTQVALVLAVAAVVAVFVRGVAAARRPPESFGRVATFLSITQAGAFLGQEVLERLVTHAPLFHLLHEALLPVGVSMQIGLALAGAALLRWLTRTSSSIATLLAPPHRPPRAERSVQAPTTWDRPTVPVLVASIGVRAPPAA